MITEALKAIALCLKESGIPYMVMGGQAVLQYGETRFTQDIDITLAFTPDEVDRIIEPLQSCGFSPVPADYLSFLKDTWVLPVEHLKTKTRLDLIFSILPFERTAIDNALDISVDEVSVRFVTAEDLVIQKIFAGRPRDIQDAEGILSLQKGKIDLEKVREVIVSLSKEMADRTILERLKDLTEFFD